MRDSWRPAWVGLGSNLDDPQRHIMQAFGELAVIDRTRCVATSTLYHSEPCGGPLDQPRYVNAVAALLTRLTPEALLAALQAIERAHGRKRGVRHGPRTLDLDLLMYHDCVQEDPKLTLPHPQLHLRNFVLHPLAELAPHVRVPGRGTVAALAAASGTDGLIRAGASR